MRKFLKVTVILCILQFIVICTLYSWYNNDKKSLLRQQSAEENKFVFTFNHSDLAYDILKAFDKYEPIPAPWKTRISNGSYYVKREDGYCNHSRRYFIDNAKEIFLKKIVITDNLAISKHGSRFPSDIFVESFLDSIILKTDSFIGEPILVNKRKSIAYLNNNLHFYYVGLKNNLHYNHVIGSTFGCNHQMYNHIYGVEELWAKSRLAINYQKYRNKYANRPKCVEEFAPPSYILSDGNQCSKFFDFINSQDYVEAKLECPYAFLTKEDGLHRGQGVSLFDQKEEDQLRNAYSNGTNCGKIDTIIQMQRYINNPLLLYGYKFDFRIFMLIASTDPLIAYYYDGFVKLSLSKYEKNSTNESAHIFMPHFADAIFATAAKHGWNGMNENEVKEFQTWMYGRFQTYLIENHIVNDTNWIENNLKPQMKKAMIHVLRMSSHGFWKKSNLCELHGLDFILDENLKLWFIESNPTPYLEAPNETRQKLINRLLHDFFEINFSYLRSRMKRIVQFVNRISEILSLETNLPENILFRDYEVLKREYHVLNKNYLESEFVIPRTNGFELILDENEKGMEKYAGYLSEECLA